MEMILLFCLASIYLASVLFKIFGLNKLFAILQYVAFILHFGALVLRSVLAQHPPFTNVYESLLLLSWLLELKFLFFQKIQASVLRIIQSFVVLIFIAVLMLLPPSTREVQAVMPALNSAWMYIHVPAYMFSYVALFSGSILAVLRLLNKKNEFPYDEQMNTDMALTMMFMVLGMVTGAIWGQVSWGNFWSWDPKETWALINIVILTQYFHTHNPKHRAVIAILTALSVLFTYFGVTWLSPGLHSYS